MSSGEEEIISALDRLGASYEVIEIDPEFSDTEAFCGKYGYPPDRTCNTIIVTSKRGPKKYAACVILAHTRLDVNKRVTGLLGVAKASFAPAEAALLECSSAALRLLPCRKTCRSMLTKE